MSVLAVALLSIGVTDLVRLKAWGDAQRGQIITLLAGLVTLAMLAVLTDLTGIGDLLLLIVSAAMLCGWVVTSSGRRSGAAAVPLLVLGGGCAVLLGASGAASEAGGAFSRWLDWTGFALAGTATSPDAVLLIVGLMVVQVATANQVVRLVLTHIGALSASGVAQPSDRLRGGRILGPMERLIILGLGLAGEVTAASLVIAAKGLIRWPELRQSDLADPDSVGVDEVTEYFLVGSMVSWLLALAALAVALLV